MKKEKEKEKEKKKKKEKKAQAQIKKETEAAPVQVLVSDTEDAQLAAFLRIAGGKWKLRILLALHEGKKMRYGQIRALIPGITDMMLSQSLRELTESALVLRHQYQEIPPKVEYSLTKTGIALLPAIHALCEWVQSYTALK